MKLITEIYRDVGSEAGKQRGSDGVRDGGVGVSGLLTCSGNDVKANEGVKAGGGALHHLDHHQRERERERDSEREG